MKIQRIYAPDMRQGIRRAREALGPDAVILSSRRVDDGVEVMAAIDIEQVAAGVGQPPPADQPAVAASHGRDPGAEPAQAGRAPAGPRTAASAAGGDALADMQREMHTLRSLFEQQLAVLEWRRIAGQHPARSVLLDRLARLGLGGGFGRELVEALPDGVDPERGWRMILQALQQRITVTDDDILSRGGVVALVGPTGVGKTTTVAKLAARYALRHGRQRVALVSADAYRIGAREQLHNFGRIIGIPVKTAEDSDALHQVLGELDDKDLVLIDTAGMSQRDMRLMEQFQRLSAGAEALRAYLVVSAHTQLPVLNDVVRSFGEVGLSGCILTKLDEAAALGGAITALARHRLPLAYLTTGQRVPEDLAPARAEHLVAQACELAERQQDEDRDDYWPAAMAGRGSAHVYP